MKTLCIYIPSTIPTANSNSNMLTLIPSLISNISSPQLQRITFYLDSNFHLLIWPWDDFLRSLNALPVSFNDTDSPHSRQVAVTFVVRVLSGMRSFKVQMNWVSQLMHKGYNTGSKSWRWTMKAERLTRARDRGEIWRDWIE